MNEDGHFSLRGHSFTEHDVKELFWLGDQIPGGFFIYRADAGQEILYVNRSMLRIFGCEDEAQFRELTGNTFRGIVHLEDFEEIQSSIDAQIGDESNRQHDYVEYRIIRRDGQIRWIEDYGHFAHLPGYGDVYYVFISDATEKRSIQNEKMRIEVALEREKQVNEMKSRFLFNMSHDIRTPMNAIIGFSELAKRHSHEPDLLAGYLDKTIASGKQMLVLIDDMLEMNELVNGCVNLYREDTDLRRQLDLVMDLYRREAERKGILLQAVIEVPDVPVLADQSRLRRVLSNLLSNAIKFTPSGGTVTLTARQRHVSESGYARYVFQVIDTGIGMSRDFQNSMYDPFEREYSSTQSGEYGTGLGLSIVQRLLRLLGGSISCSSEQGKGTTFTVELPLRLSESGAVVKAAEAPAAHGETHAEGEYRLLVVDDIEMNRDVAEMLLEEAGFIVESVSDGCDAVEIVKQHPAGYYDLILMDIQMPVMNGYEATHVIRSLPQGNASLLSIIALSANAREEDVRRSLESGMDSHVAKPFDIDALVMTINTHIHLKKARTMQQNA